MISLFRHIAARVWISGFIWIFAVLGFLPAFQSTTGITLRLLPATLLFIGVYMLTGLILTRFAQIGIEKHLADVSIWQRAGMLKEAEKTLTAAVALFDSFLLSPKGREPYHEKLLISAARHRLNCSKQGIALDSCVISYLDRFPEDREAARIWLQSAIELEDLSPKLADLIAKLATAQPDNKELQHLLGRAFLFDGRTDFEALQVYHRVLAAEGYSDHFFLNDLAHILAAEGFLNDWAFDIYLKVYGRVSNSPMVFKAILACIEKFKAHKHHRPLLKRARNIMADTAAEHPGSGELEIIWKALQSNETLISSSLEKSTTSEGADNFSQPSKVADTNLRPQRVRYGNSNLFNHYKQTILSAFDSIRDQRQNLSAMMSAVFKQIPSMGFIRNVAVGAICAGILFFGVNIILLISQEEPQAPKTTPPAPIENKTDRFTLQVAAYLSRSDAVRYIQKLKHRKLKAYLTEAHGRDKKWYQVRISQFTSSNEAKRYGETLKSKGVINDYYVAEYKSPLKTP